MTSTPIHVSTSQPPTVARHPAFPAAIAFLAGIGVHSLLPHHALLWLAAAACMLLLAVGCRRRGLLATLLLCTTWAIAGVAAGQIHSEVCP